MLLRSKVKMYFRLYSCYSITSEYMSLQPYCNNIWPVSILNTQKYVKFTLILNTTYFQEELFVFANKRLLVYKFSKKVNIYYDNDSTTQYTDRNSSLLNFAIYILYITVSTIALKVLQCKKSIFETSYYLILYILYLVILNFIFVLTNCN